MHALSLAFRQFRHFRTSNEPEYVYFKCIYAGVRGKLHTRVQRHVKQVKKKKKKSNKRRAAAFMFLNEKREKPSVYKTARKASENQQRLVAVFQTTILQEKLALLNLKHKIRNIQINKMEIRLFDYCIYTTGQNYLFTCCFSYS